MPFKKVAIVGFKAKKVKSALKKHFQISNSHPDFVVSYGGDGTILYSERKYPGIPKLAFRNSRICRKCAARVDPRLHKASLKVYCESCLETAIQQLISGKFKVWEFNKVEATALYSKKGRRLKKKIWGLNEVQIHNSNHIHAVRFDFCLDGVCLEEEIIGDGVVVATAYGSTAYFYAISRKLFSRGFGIGFNNPLRKIKPLFFKNDFQAEAHILRRNALLIADNNAHFISLKKGDKVVFKPSKEKARIIQLL